MNTINTNTINTEQLRNEISKTNASLFRVSFVKANGEHRNMFCKTQIKRYLSKRPNKRVLQNTNPNIVRVFDMESKSYKSFKLDSVFEFRSGKVVLKSNNEE